MTDKSSVFIPVLNYGYNVFTSIALRGAGIVTIVNTDFTRCFNESSCILRINFDVYRLETQTKPRCKAATWREHINYQRIQFNSQDYV
jgi:hypothetical protein